MADEKKECLFTTEQLSAELDRLRGEYETKIKALEAGLDLKIRESENQSSAVAKANEDYLNEYVAIKLFRDNGKYRDDVYVAVNGKNCIIRRGEWVKIRRKFALVLDQSEIQDMKTAEFMENEQAKFTQISRRIDS